MEWKNPYTKEEIEKFIDICILHEQVHEFNLKFWKMICGFSTNKE